MVIDFHLGVMTRSTLGLDIIHLHTVLTALILPMDFTMTLIIAITITTTETLIITTKQFWLIRLTKQVLVPMVPEMVV
jgi:hypothetical protein